jgi:hypothetical protein
MKWFKHYSDAYTNLKLQNILITHGMEGYGLYWLILELVAQQSDLTFAIDGAKNWKSALLFYSRINPKKLENILNSLVKNNLISVVEDTLSIPKMADYADEYSKRSNKLPILSRQTTDKVPLEEKRRDKKRIEKKRLETSDDFLDYILSHKTFPKLAEKYPDRDYRLEIEKMCNWWTEKYGSPPQRPISAFSNWLVNAKIDPTIVEKRKDAAEKEKTKKLTTYETSAVKPETLEKLREATKDFKNKFGNQ